MAKQARVQTAVLAKERNLFVNKGTAQAPSWVLVGCATGKDYGLANEMIKLNCDSGARQVDSGEDPVYDFQLNGFVFQYAEDELATNVSAEDFETWASVKPQVRRQYKYEGKYANDTIRTFWAYIASFRESGTNGEAMTYTVGLNIDEPPVLSK
jgi:hypothetical protein